MKYDSFFVRTVLAAIPPTYAAKEQYPLDGFSVIINARTCTTSIFPQTVIVITSEYLYGLFRTHTLPRLSWVSPSARPACATFHPLHRCTIDVFYIPVQTRHLRVCNAPSFASLNCCHNTFLALTHTIITIIVQSLSIHIQSSYFLACDIHYDLPSLSIPCLSSSSFREAFYLITARLYLCTISKL